MAQPSRNQGIAASVLVNASTPNEPAGNPGSVPHIAARFESGFVWSSFWIGGLRPGCQKSGRGVTGWSVSEDLEAEELCRPGTNGQVR